MADNNGSANWPTAANMVPAFISVNASRLREKDVGGRVVVGVTCCLSIIGSILILLSYCLQKRRTKAKQILVHISLMDLGAALANLIGLSVYFDHYYVVNDDATYIEVPKHIDTLCKVQAFFAMLFSMSSVLWTTALAIYLYAVILHSKKPEYSKYILWASYIICYGLALLFSLWSLLTEKLGYAPYDAPGWCTLITIDPLNIHKRYVFNAVFIYDIWIYVTAFLIIVIYIALKCFVSIEAKRMQNSYQISPKQLWSSMNHVDYKFIFIPVIFVLLRMWSVILDMLFIYAGLRDNQIPTVIEKLLLYLGGIGDSGQGFTNAILFILFTKNVRKSFIRFLCCKCGQPDDDDDTTTVTYPTYTTIQNSTENSDDEDERTPLYVAALLEDSQKLADKNQPV